MIASKGESLPSCIARARRTTCLGLCRSFRWWTSLAASTKGATISFKCGDSDTSRTDPPHEAPTKQPNDAGRSL